jgi:hypothetical protein
MEKDRNDQAVTTVLGDFSWVYQELLWRRREYNFIFFERRYWKGSGPAIRRGQRLAADPRCE